MLPLSQLRWALGIRPDMGCMQVNGVPWLGPGAAAMLVPPITSSIKLTKLTLPPP